MNWLGRLIQLPEVFLNTPTGRGGGIIQVVFLYYWNYIYSN